MSTQSSKRLIQFCDFLSVISLLAAISHGFGNILDICYEMGKDDTDTFIWQALLQSIEGYAIFFIGVLTFIMVQKVKKGKIFCHVNQRILFAIGISTVLSGICMNAIVNLAPIDTCHQNSVLLLIIGLVCLLISLVFKVGIRLKEENDLTI